MLLFDFESALDRFMGEKDILLEVLTPYLENLNNLLEKLSSLKQPFDFDQLRQIAHSIKGSSLNLDIVPLGKAAEELEDLAYNRIEKGIQVKIDRVKDLAAQTESELQKYITL
ncbi:Hpt domain-containing protein [Thiospirochaeta perfilievii]|uniref:Hpt domain-containing protein n=1 Tax=Thiospirochaeta perfilievii TaxID=252967 RepID=A0A5C1QA06_9SPIO|nr:Hpt domain-containing protein [Thiospirochaeta perfilievii]QEN04895.1 Hpt domain-containing protein [Thiospirochaeta perfilievii]